MAMYGAILPDGSPTPPRYAPVAGRARRVHSGDDPQGVPCETSDSYRPDATERPVLPTSPQRRLLISSVSPAVAPATSPATTSTMSSWHPAPLGMTVEMMSPVTSQEHSLLYRWGTRLRDTYGVLLTPPRGHIAEDVQQTRTYVEDMISRLAGERLAREGVHLVVNLYSSARMNAFATEHGQGIDPKGVDGEWPIRRFLGYT